jgi:hypothetical protein
VYPVGTTTVSARLLATGVKPSSGSLRLSLLPQAAMPEPKRAADASPKEPFSSARRPTRACRMLSKVGLDESLVPTSSSSTEVRGFALMDRFFASWGSANAGRTA